MDLESRLNLLVDAREVAYYLLEHDGAVKRESAEDNTYWLILTPVSAPTETYYVRVGWQSYPHQPPSVKFADRVRGSLQLTSSWPVIPGYRPTSFDICQPFTAEGYNLHLEWRSGPEAWTATGNPFLWVVQTLQNDLDIRYVGRSA